MNQIDLKGQHAIVTGGAQGLGFAMAKRIADSGARVTIWDLDDALAQEAKKALGPMLISVLLIKPALPLASMLGLNKTFT